MRFSALRWFGLFTKGKVLNLEETPQLLLTFQESEDMAPTLVEIELAIDEAATAVKDAAIASVQARIASNAAAADAATALQASTDAQTALETAQTAYTSLLGTLGEISE